VPEIGVAGGSAYSVIEGDGTILWSSPIDDSSSSVTGSTLFDFENDGVPEVVYNDHDFLRIYDGATGVVLAELANPNWTAMEFPTLADVDGDGEAEIIVGATGIGTAGLSVFGDALGRWPLTRNLWNQHSYHITNVNDDLTIPQFEANSWEAFNSYRQNLWLCE